MLPCNIPTQIVKPLTVIKKILYLLRLTIKTIHIIQLSTNKRTPTLNLSLFPLKPFRLWYKLNIKQNTSHTSPIRNTPDKLSSVMNNRTLRDLTNLLDPYKRNPSETPLTTLTHILHCYDRTHKLLQTLDLDSQRITQSSQAIQSALESITTLFISTNLH